MQIPLSSNVLTYFFSFPSKGVTSVGSRVSIHTSDMDHNYFSSVNHELTVMKAGVD